jgi:4-hydroxy-tetrahydrodipicolinate reductase
VTQSQTLSVCIAGATGWTGRALVPAVVEAPDLALGAAVSRSAAGRDLGEALGGAALGVPVHARVADALEGIDVLIDYTSATAVKDNTMAAIDAGVAVVVGSSGSPRRTSRRSTPPPASDPSASSRPATSR